MARYAPLVAHVVPTLVVGYGWVLPRNGAAGWNELTIGFALSVAGTCVVYVLGQRLAHGAPKGGADRASS